MASILSRIFGATARTAKNLFGGGTSATAPRPARSFGPGQTIDTGPYRQAEVENLGRQFNWTDPSTWSHPHQGVTSSNLRSVAYDVNHQLMQIIFMKAGPNNGDTYNYTGVPAYHYFGLMSAPSKGRYHHAYIRCEYPYSDLSGISKLEGCAKNASSRLRGPVNQRGTGLAPTGREPSRIRPYTNIPLPRRKVFG